ncbi:MAG: hypothetical protein ACOYYJ_06930 [Chloroflexota bacterium]
MFDSISSFPLPHFRFLKMGEAGRGSQQPPPADKSSIQENPRPARPLQYKEEHFEGCARRIRLLAETFGTISTAVSGFPKISRGEAADRAGSIDASSGLIGESSGLIGASSGLIGELSGLIPESSGLIGASSGLIPKSSG